jgi:serine/threonine protein kinase
MTPEQWGRVRKLFDDALGRPPQERTGFLESECPDAGIRAEVERLLANAGHTNEPLNGPQIEGLRRASVAALDASKLQGWRIDRYEILRELGRGGMGSVYLAVRADDVYSKPVALKLVRPEAGGEEVVQRFRQEREILATLDHPNIAHLLDGGSTAEGLPYFVMDYIEGQPIDCHCDERLLPVAERLKLFSTVCAAVEYAHQHGVIHRDLKPSNILVNANGVVKLLDFGIAKLLRTGAEEATAYMTRSGIRLMTPEYASPEQVTGDTVGIATDLYSLGVILYELLTGHRPYRMRTRLIHEVMRVICEEEPTRPSVVVATTEEWPIEKGRAVTITPQTVSRMRETTPVELRRSLAGDLDNVLLKAMRKEPAARYASAGAFREDLLRRLDGLPVLAQGRSWSYRAGKFLKRQRWWVAASVVVTAGIATGLIRISPVAVILAGMFLLISILGQYGAKANFGGEFASRMRFRATILAAFLLMVSAAWLYLLLNGYQLGRYLALLVSVYYLRLLFRWPFRGRWAGPLLVEATRPTPRLIFLFNTAIAAYSIFLAALAFRWGDLSLGYVPVAGVPFVAYRFWIWGKVEMRVRGLLGHGHLVRWHKIQSYAWESTDPGIAILRLQVMTRFHRAVHVSFPVTTQSKDAIAAVLEEHLSEWPGRP